MNDYIANKDLNKRPIPKDQKRIELRYDYYYNTLNAGALSSCGISITFKPMNQFRYMSIYNAKRTCFKQAEKIASNPQILGTKAKKISKMYNNPLFRNGDHEGYSIMYKPCSDKHFRNSDFIYKIY